MQDSLVRLSIQMVRKGTREDSSIVQPAIPLPLPICIRQISLQYDVLRIPE